MKIINRYVKELLEKNGIAPGSLVIESGLCNLNHVLGKHARYTRIGKVFLNQEIVFITQAHEGNGFICGQYPVNRGMGKSASLHLIGRTMFRGVEHEFDVIVSWSHVAFVGNLNESLVKREMLVDKLIESLQTRKEIAS